MKFILYIFIALFAFIMCGMCLYTAITSEDNIKMLFCTIVSAAVAVVALLFAGGIIK